MQSTAPSLYFPGTPSTPGTAAAAVAAALSSQGIAPRVPGGAVRGPCFIKVLVQDRLAGVLIGKGGVGIAELEGATGATMRLSGSRVYFPGTTERVVVAGGDMPAIEKMISVLVEKLNSTDAGEGVAILRLVLTNSACAAVIGKGGDVIKSISQKTNANIRASDRSSVTQERIVEVKGPSAISVVQAVVDIAHIIQEDSSFREFAAALNYFPQETSNAAGSSSSYFYPTTPHSQSQSLAAAAAAAGAQAALMPGQRLQTNALVDQYPISIDFAVPSAAVGAIIGKNGEARNRIVHSTGANLVVSERTSDPLAERKITISGPLVAVQAALSLVARLVVEAQ